jgi:hypothetical protein
MERGGRNYYDLSRQEKEARVRAAIRRLNGEQVASSDESSNDERSEPTESRVRRSHRRPFEWSGADAELAVYNDIVDQRLKQREAFEAETARYQDSYAAQRVRPTEDRIRRPAPIDREVEYFEYDDDGPTFIESVGIWMNNMGNALVDVISAPVVLGWKVLQITVPIVVVAAITSFGIVFLERSGIEYHPAISQPAHRFIDPVFKALAHGVDTLDQASPPRTTIEVAK